MKIIANIDPPWDEKVIRCAQGCDDFIVLTAEQIDDDEWVEISVVSEMRPYNFADMLKGCWSLFRHGRFHRASADLSRTTLLEMAEWCTATLHKLEEGKL